MRKFILRISLFVIFLLITNSLIRVSVPYWWGNPGYAKKYSYLYKNRGKYNTVFLGSSRLYRHVIPKVFNKKVKNKKIRSFNMAYAATSNPEQFYLTKKLLKEDWFSFKYVFVELSPFQKIAQLNLHSSRVKYYMNPKVFIQSLSIFNESGDLNFILFYNYFISTIEYLFNINLLDDYIGFIAKENSIEVSDSDWLKKLDGFSYFKEKKGSKEYKLRHKPFLRKSDKILKTLNKKARNNVLTYANEAKEYNKAYFKLVKELLEIAKDKEIHIVFVMPPRMNGGDIILPVANQIPDENKISIYDNKKYPQFYNLKNSFDKGHLNANGARKFTKILAREFDKKLEN